MIDLSKYKILVIDDDPDMLVFVKTVLEDNGASVFTAFDGIDGLKAAKIIIPDLITLDLSMPEMDGGEVYQAIRNDSEIMNIPVCIITGKPELRGLIYSRTIPLPEGYMKKPVDEKTLLLNIRKILTLAQHKS
ncbi:PleD family two-component system response regulator [Calditrichota bacterium]